MHAMRGISAHTNGFPYLPRHHILQLLLGTIDVPRGFRYKPPFPPIPPAAEAFRPEQVQGEHAAGGPPLGFPGPEELLIDADGTPAAYRQGLLVGSADRGARSDAHRSFTMPGRRIRIKIDTMFMYMANMSWNSSMNTSGTMKHADRHRPGNGRIQDPLHHLFGCVLFRKWFRMPILILPDTTYLERHDCISLLDRPISHADAAADAIRHPVVELDRDVRPFQTVILNLGARLGLPGMTQRRRFMKYPGGCCDYMVNHERSSGIGPLCGWRGENGDSTDRCAEPGPTRPIHRKRCFWQHELPENQRFYKLRQQRLSGMGREEPVHRQFRSDRHAIYSEPLQKFGWRPGPWRDASRRNTSGHASTILRPAADLVPPLEESMTDTRSSPSTR